MFDVTGHVRELSAVLSDTSGLQNSEHWSDIAFTAQSTDGQTTINDAVITLTDGRITGGPLEQPWRRTFSAYFAVSAPMTGDNRITVRTTQEFSTPHANTCYSSGTLVATAGDESSVEMHADNGNPAAFLFAVSSPNSFSGGLVFLVSRLCASAAAVCSGRTESRCYAGYRNPRQVSH